MNSQERGQRGIGLECIGNRTASFGSQHVELKTECRNLDEFLWALFVGDWNNTHGWCGVHMCVRNIVHACHCALVCVMMWCVSTRRVSVITKKSQRQTIDALKIPGMTLNTTISHRIAYLMIFSPLLILARASAIFCFLSASSAIVLGFTNAGFNFAS